MSLIEKLTIREEKINLVEEQYQAHEKKLKKDFLAPKQLNLKKVLKNTRAQVNQAQKNAETAKD